MSDERRLAIVAAEEAAIHLVKCFEVLYVPSFMFDPSDRGYIKNWSREKYDEYTADTLVSVDEFSKAYYQLDAALKVDGVANALSRVHESAVVLGNHAGSYIEAFHSFCGRYIGRLLRLTHRARDGRGPIEISIEALATKPYELIESLASMGELKCRTPELLIRKESIAAQECACGFSGDPWAVNMLELLEARGGHLTDTEAEIVAIVRESDGLVSSSDIEDQLAKKFGDAKAGSAANPLAFLTRTTILTKGPGGRGYQLGRGVKP